MKIHVVCLLQAFQFTFMHFIEKNGSHGTVYRPTKVIQTHISYKFESHNTTHILKNYFFIVFLAISYLNTPVISLNEDKLNS